MIGALPALLVLYLRRGLSESERWITAVEEHHWQAIEATEPLAADNARRPFTLAAIWKHRESRKRLVFASLLSLSTVIGWWAVSTLLPRFTNQLAKAGGPATTGEAVRRCCIWSVPSWPIAYRVS